MLVPMFLVLAAGLGAGCYGFPSGKLPTASIDTAKFIDAVKSLSPIRASQTFRMRLTCRRFLMRPSAPHHPPDASSPRGTLMTPPESSIAPRVARAGGTLMVLTPASLHAPLMLPMHHPSLLSLIFALSDVLLRQPRTLTRSSNATHILSALVQPPLRSHAALMLKTLATSVSLHPSTRDNERGSGSGSTLNGPLH